MNVITNSLLSLLFPEVCRGCKSALSEGEKILCLDCRVNLPRTGFHHHSDNPVRQLFYGRIPLRAATSLFYFKKQTKVQNLIHCLKYKGQEELSLQLGEMMGSELCSASLFNGTDLVVPVPLHEKRLKERGYNQSEGFANGIAQSLSTGFSNATLIRKKETKTQTRKGRDDRWNNVMDVFSVAEPECVYNKNVLLVDDVVTTGATLEACSNSLLEEGALSVSIATIAFADI